MPYHKSDIERLLTRIEGHLRRKLSLPKNMAKPHWQHMSYAELALREREEQNELGEAILSASLPDDVWDEAVDQIFFVAAQADKYAYEYDDDVLQGET